MECHAMEYEPLHGILNLKRNPVCRMENYIFLRKNGNNLKK